MAFPKARFQFCSCRSRANHPTNRGVTGTAVKKKYRFFFNHFSYLIVKFLSSTVRQRGDTSPRGQLLRFGGCVKWCSSQPLG